MVDYEWFESQYEDIKRTKQIHIESKFRINKHNLNIFKKDTLMNLSIKYGSKRDPVYDNNKVWVDTEPKSVIDYGGQDSTILKFKLNHQKELFDKKEKEYVHTIASLESELAKERDSNQSQSAAKHPEEPVMMLPITESSTVLELPPQHPTEAKNPKKPKKPKKLKPK